MHGTWPTEAFIFVHGDEWGIESAGGGWCGGVEGAVDFDGGDIDVLSAGFDVVVVSLTAVVEVSSSTATGTATAGYCSVMGREGSFAGFVGDFRPGGQCLGILFIDQQR